MINDLGAAVPEDAHEKIRKNLEIEQRAAAEKTNELEGATVQVN